METYRKINVLHSNENHETVNGDVFQAIVEGLDEAILLFADGETLLYANRSARKLFSIFQAAIGDSASELLPQELMNLYRSSDHIDVRESNVHELEFQLSSGDRVWAEIRLGKMKIGDQRFSQIGLRDISHLKKKVTILQKEATTDFLSGLSNRRQFRRLLDKHGNENICLAVVDVDHFKNINDSFGHSMGDKAIRFVASKLVEFFGNEICVARLGGEEFGVVLRAVEQKEIQDLFELFRQSIQSDSFADQAISLTVSIGLAFPGGADNDVHDLLLQADKALYESKHSGRNQVTTFA